MIEPNELYSYCKTSQWFHEYIKTNHSANTVNMIFSDFAMRQIGLCDGYVIGVMNSNWNISIPDDLSLDDVITLFITYMDKHPELKKYSMNERIKKGSFLYSAQIINRSLIESGKVKCLNDLGYGDCKKYI